MKAIRVLALLAFLCTIALADGKNPLATRAEEINHVEDQFSIVTRPEGKSLNEILQCRAQDLFDESKILFTESDFKSLSELKCNDRFCVGDKAPFDATLAVAIKRTKERIEFMKSMKDVMVNIHGADTIPSTLSWKNYSEGEDELKGRWHKILTFWVLKEVLKAPKPDEVNVKDVQNVLIDLIIRDLSDQNERWSKVSDEEKEQSLIHARMTCMDKYARLIKANAYSDRGVNSAMVDYPITTGLEILPDGEGGYVIVGTIPGSKASRSRQFLPLDTVKSITYDGKKFDLGKPEGTAFFRTALEDKKPLELEIERDGKAMTLKTETGHSLPLDAVVTSQNRVVDGKRFRIVSVPMYVAEDKKLSPDEYISTVAQVQYALADRKNYDAVVLDLRGNGGGVASEGALLPALFLSAKDNPTAIAVSKEKGELKALTRTAKFGKPLSEVPLFVLADQASASSSEITISALLKTNRAVLIGDRTYGKGIEQVGVPLEDGSVLLQTSHVNTNFGDEPFHKKGLKPHLTVPYLSGVMKTNRESQDVQFQEESDKIAKPTFTNDYYQVNQQALQATQAWAKKQLKSRPELKEYYGSMKRLREIHNEPIYVLNLEKAGQLQAEARENEMKVVQNGSLDSAKAPFNLGFTTDWSLEQAVQYLNEAEKLKLKAEAAE